MVKELGEREKEREGEGGERNTNRDFEFLKTGKFYLVFLPRDAMRKRGLCRQAVSVCLSVTFVYCVQTAKDTIPYDSCVFRVR